MKLGDALSDAHISRWFTYVQPSLKCRDKHSVTRVCVDEKCESHSLFCEAKQCMRCSKVHEECTSIKLQALTGRIRDRKEKNKEAILQMLQMKTDLVQSIEKGFNEFAERVSLGGISDQATECINRLAGLRNDKEWVTPKKAMSVWQSLKRGEKESKLEQHIYQNIIKQCRKNTQELDKTFKSNQLSLLNKFKEMARKINFSLNLNSKVLSQESEEALLEKKFFLFDSISGPKKLELLYRASDNDFKMKEIKESGAQMNEPKLVLLKSQFGKIFGGYQAIKWNRQHKIYQATKSKTSSEFCFSLNPNKAYRFGSDNGRLGFERLAGILTYNMSYALIPQYADQPTIWDVHNKCKEITGAQNRKPFKLLEFEIYRAVI